MKELIFVMKLKSGGRNTQKNNEPKVYSRLMENKFENTSAFIFITLADVNQKVKCLRMSRRFAHSIALRSAALHSLSLSLSLSSCRRMITSAVVATKVVPVPVPLSVPGLFGCKFPVLYGSSVLYGS